MKPVYLAPFVALTFLGACGGGTEVLEEYPDVVQSQAERSFDAMQSEYFVTGVVGILAGSEQTSSLPTTGEIDFAGSAHLTRTEDTTVCTATSSCRMMGNADVTIDLNSMLLAAEIYDLNNNTAINWDGTLDLKGTVTSDGSIAAELSGSYVNPAFSSTTYTVSATELTGDVLDYLTGTANAVQVSGDAAVAGTGAPVTHSFGLIATSD